MAPRQHLGAHVVAEARADVTDRPGDFADAAGGGTHVVKVLGVPARWMEVQLVKTGTASEDKLVAEIVVAAMRQISWDRSRSCSTWSGVGHGAPCAQAVMSFVGITGWGRSWC